jgi:hypothetical protein
MHVVNTSLKVRLKEVERIRSVEIVREACAQLIKK